MAEAQKRKQQISLRDCFSRKKVCSSENVPVQERLFTEPYITPTSPSTCDDILERESLDSVCSSEDVPVQEKLLTEPNITPTSPSTSDDILERESFDSEKPNAKPLMHDISHGAYKVTNEDASLGDDQIAFFIENRIPPSSFKFPGKIYIDQRKPSGTMARRCCREWFNTFDFISYSEAEDGLYCLSCVLFPVAARQGRRADALISRPYRNWKDAKSNLSVHSALIYHRDSNDRLKTFVQTRNAPKSRVDQMLTSSADKVIAKNRRFIESIIRCIEICGRQGISLRGHRDDGNTLEIDDTSKNMGNFKAILKLLSQTDVDLREHLEQCAKTASYTSKTTQNDLLDCISDFIQGTIVGEIKAQVSGPYFGIIADEVTDSSNWEQLGIVVRYLKNDQPVERLVEYVKCGTITGEAIAGSVIQCLTNVGLDVSKCRSQTYDGAGNMAGREKGVQNQFRQKTNNQKAPYFHCASHELNLALSKASKVAEVHNMVCLMQSVGLFFKFSAKKQRALERSIEDVCEKQGKNPSISKHKVKPLCETRWVERHTAFDDMATLYEPLLDCLGRIEMNENQLWDPKSVTEASGLNAQLRSPKFVVSFVVCHYIFGFTKGLSRQLQGTSMDIVRAYGEVKHVTGELEKIRGDSNAEFSKLFSSASAMSELAQVPIAKPRLAGRQTLRTNVPAESAEEYFRRAIFIPFVDGLITQLQDRFSGASSDAIQAMFLIPSNLPKLTQNTLDVIKCHYEEDLPYPGDFLQEVRLWQRKWSSSVEQDLPSSLSDTLSKTTAEGVDKIYPNIMTILRIVLTFSATSASVERTNSALRFIKNTYRSSMSEDRFNALVLLFVHRDIQLNYKIIIDKFARKCPRRMLFSNPLGVAQD